MFSRPEPQTFTKFLISAGVFLCLAAFVGPALALQDDGALLVSRRRVAELTKVGREELLHRQSIDHEIIGRFAVPFGALLLVLGVTLIFIGLPRLRRQEHVEQARSSAELDKLLAEFVPRTQAERESRIRAEVEGDDLGSARQPDISDQASPGSAGGEHKAEDASVAEAGPSMREPSTAPATTALSQSGLVSRARQVEDEVIARIAQLGPPIYEVRAQVRLANNAGFDAVLLSDIDQIPDVVVEIKYSKTGSAIGSATRMRVEQVAATVLRYELQTGRTAAGWLIVVVDETSEMEALIRRTERTAREFGGKVLCTIITGDRVSMLSLPRAFTS